MSEALNLLFFPNFSKPFDASIIKTSVFVLFCFNTIIIVAIGVPKKIFGGSPIIVSILLFSIKFARMSPSLFPLKRTP